MPFDGTKQDLDLGARVLLRAADLIEETGWCGIDLSNDGRGPNGEVCLSWAIQAADFEMAGDGYIDAYARLGRHLNIRYDQHAGGASLLVNWNDTPGRTKEEVLSALRGAAYD